MGLCNAARAPLPRLPVLPSQPGGSNRGAYAAPRGRTAGFTYRGSVREVGQRVARPSPTGWLHRHGLLSGQGGRVRCSGSLFALEAAPGPPPGRPDPHRQAAFGPAAHVGSTGRVLPPLPRRCSPGAVGQGELPIPTETRPNPDSKVSPGSGPRIAFTRVPPTSAWRSARAAAARGSFRGFGSPARRTPRNPR